MNQIKTIDVIAYKWFDKVNGNSYFAGTVSVNYGMDDMYEINMPFEYGYGDYYVQAAREALKEHRAIPTNINSLTEWCRDNNIVLRTNKHKNCKKRDLMVFKASPVNS